MIKSDLKLVLPILYLLNFCGCNPMNNSKRQRVLQFCIILFNVVWMVLCLLNLKTRQHLFGMGEDIFSIFAISQVLVKTVVLFMYGDTFVRIIKTLEKGFWSLEFTKYHRILSIVGKCYGVLILITTISIVFDPVIKGKRKPPMEFWGSNEFLCLQSPFFELVYMLQIITVYMPIMTGISTFDILYYFFIGFGIIQFELLKTKLSDIRKIVADSRNPDEIKTIIKVCVKHHNLLLDYLKDIDTAFRFAILSQFIGAVFFMCFTSYLHTLEYVWNLTLSQMFRSTYSLKFPIIAVAAVFQTMLFCLSGELITNQSADIGNVVYDLPWEDIRQTGIVSSLCLMIQMSQREVKLTAGRMVDLSLRSFVTLSRAALSYYVFLKEVIRNE